MSHVTCRHCGATRNHRSRGLCTPCFYDPAVLARYPRRFTWDALERLDTGPRPLPEPTAAIPGTAEKLAVLEVRARLGQQLWHPLDAGGFGLRLGAAA